MMKKNNLMSYLALGIVFALFNVIAFVIPTDKTATFWTAYIFSVVAFAVQIPLWNITLGKKDTLKSKFLGIPVIHVGIVNLIIQLIADLRDFYIGLIFDLCHSGWQNQEIHSSHTDNNT